MDCLTNPKIAPAYIASASIILVLTGAIASQTRLQTVFYETQNKQISAYRADSCRVLEAGDKLILGAYYYQPSPDNENAGEWLNEGVYVCDFYGSSGRIERGGYLQYLTPGDAVEMNRKLQARLNNRANPDSNPALRVRRDRTVPIYQSPTPTQTNETTFFDPSN